MKFYITRDGSSDTEFDPYWIDTDAEDESDLDAEDLIREYLEDDGQYEESCKGLWWTDLNKTQRAWSACMSIEINLEVKK